MTPAINFRLTSFALAIGLLAGLIAWAALTTLRQVVRLEAFDSSKIASYEIADHLQTTILRLNNILDDYPLKPDQQTLARFWQGCGPLNARIGTQKKPGRASFTESNLLNQIDAA